MASQAERIQALEIQQGSIQTTLKNLDKNMVQFGEDQSSIRTTLDNWNGGIAFLTKAVFLVSALSAIGLAIFKVLPA